MVQHAWIHIPDYPDPFEVTSWLCSKVDQGQCQNYPFLIVHFKCKSNYTKWSNMRLSIFRITRIVCGHKFTLFKSEPRSGSKSFLIVHFNIRVRIYPDSSPVGHDPFLGQYNPESVSKWPRSGWKLRIIWVKAKIDHVKLTQKWVNITQMLVEI